MRGVAAAFAMIGAAACQPSPSEHAAAPPEFIVVAVDAQGKVTVNGKDVPPRVQKQFDDLSAARISVDGKSGHVSGEMNGRQLTEDEIRSMSALTEAFAELSKTEGEKP